MVERGDWGTGDDRRMLQTLVASGATQVRKLEHCINPHTLSRMCCPARCHLESDTLREDCIG